MSQEQPKIAAAQENPPAQITTESPLKPVKIEYPQRKTKVFQVFEHEFDSLTSIGNSLDLTLGGISFGAVLTLGITMATVTFTSVMLKAAFIAGLIVAAVFTVFFGVRAVLGAVRTRKEIQRIKTESPPVTQ